MRLLGHLRAESVQFLVGFRGDLLRIIGNEILLHPRCSLCLVGEIEVAAFRFVKKLLRRGHCRRTFLPRCFRGRWVLRCGETSKYQTSQCATKTQLFHSARLHATAFCVFATTSFSTNRALSIPARSTSQRSEERRVGKECRSRWSP